MALFQKKPQVSDTLPYYTLGQHKTVLIVGLGNIGQEYEGTRHNIGFTAVERFVTDHSSTKWIDKKDLHCQFTTTQLGETRVIIVKPTTFMNLSGKAVQAVVNFYKINPSDIVVVHDELDIPFGQIRIRKGGSSAGHNGIKSITEQLGENYGRIRIGIGPKEPEQMDSAAFVLAKFTSEQQRYLSDLSREASTILSEYIYGGKLTTETRTFIVA